MQAARLVLPPRRAEGLRSEAFLVEVFSIALAAFLGGIGGGIVYPIIPLLGVRFGLSPTLIGLILASNRLTRLAVNAVTGSVIDRFGGKRPLLAGLAIEAVAAAGYWIGLSSAAPGLWFLLSRALWGVGSSAVFVGALTLGL